MTEIISSQFSPGDGSLERIAFLRSEMPDLSGPDGPFFIGDATAMITDSDLLLIAKSEISPEVTILEIMEKLGMVVANPRSVIDKNRQQTILASLEVASKFYSDRFLNLKGYHGPSHHIKIRGLRLDTKAHNDKPLIKSIINMSNKVPPINRITDTEAIARLLVEYEFANKT